ncbi:MAG TPA: helicase-exonuclease AddAB subunit AddB [Chondromyces sp.]|nr:helicase-exonuclease AddAB subunit AddB [Chondromyces sp.]
MSVRFIIGRAGMGKTEQVLNEIKQELALRPKGNPIIYLVPEQMTFLSEYGLASAPGLGGIIRAQVYSFTRLAWRILQETGGMGRYHISDAGLNMLIRKIIEEKKDELNIFTRAADKSGFISHVDSMLTEFKRYGITPEELGEKREELQGREASKALLDKMNDLQTIYSDYEQSLIGKYVDSEDYLRLLAEAIGQSEYLRDADIYIDGFHSFTPQEYMVIEQLMRTARRVTITLTVDQPFKSDSPDDIHLFRMTGEAYSTLYEIVRSTGIELEEDVLLQEPRRYVEKSLVHLEAHFEAKPVPPLEESSNITLFQAGNRRAEVEGVAREIRKLARSEGYRYEDIAVLIRNGNEYHRLIETVFDDYEIPFFIDQKRPMFNHPLIELIRSTLEIINSHWRYEPVFRAVKTDLLFPPEKNWASLREQMDRMENYVLAFGIQGDRWTSKERWIYRRYRGLELMNAPQTDEEREIEQEMNELRAMIAAPIARMARRLKKAENGRDLCEALYLYLEELDIPEKMERMSMEAENRGDLVAAREHNQAWNAVVELLDQYVEVLGEESISLKKFTSIIDAGLEAMKFALVPPAIDQVIVANLELSRLSRVKAAFILGVNDGVLPAKITEEGILADDDRERLIESGMKVAASSKTRLLDEEFIAYKAFTTPSHRLYVSYPSANDEGKALLPSPYIKRLKELFPSLEEKLLVPDPSELDEMHQLDYVCHPNPTLSYLTTQLQLKLHQYPVYDLWWDVYNYYLKHPALKEKSKHVLSSLFYENKTEKLDEETSKQLYGEEILASVSRMELFNSCPFSHFVSHGLKLRDREIYRLQAPDIGELFHGALKWISDEVERRGMLWSKLTKEQCIQLAKEAVFYLAPKLQNQILLSSNRHHYIKQKLESIISRASYILSEQAKISGFSPVGIELGFGPKAELPPFTFSLKNGTKMALAGRIDRVDQAKEEDDIFLRVIDYKSSGHDLDLTEVYYGLALQMLTYLDIVVTHSQKLVGGKASPAGVLYFHVHNPIVSSKKMLTIEEIEKEILKSFKMKGLILEDREVVTLMDETLDNGKTSQIVSAGIKKDGSLTSASKVASEEQFSDMRKYVRKLYQDSGNRIMSGDVEILPYKYKKKTPCQFCSYRSLCQFDQSLDENDYRLIIPEKPKEILELMHKEANNIGKTSDR